MGQLLNRHKGDAYLKNSSLIYKFSSFYWNLHLHLHFLIFKRKLTKNSNSKVAQKRIKQFKTVSNHLWISVFLYFWNSQFVLFILALLLHSLRPLFRLAINVKTTVKIVRGRCKREGERKTPNINNNWQFALIVLTTKQSVKYFVNNETKLTLFSKW